MFDGWIDIVRLAQAFSLTEDDCLELARHVEYKFVPTNQHKAYDLEEINHHAKEYARELMDNPDQSAAFCVYYSAMAVRYGDTGQQISDAWNTGYKSLWDCGKLQEAFAGLWPIVRLYFLLDWQVEKYSAVRFLTEAGYPFQKEVKGLSKAMVDGILTDAKAKTSGAKLTGSRKDKARIEATRQACESVRKEIEQEQHGFSVNGEYRINWEYFKDAVSIRLGPMNPHIDTARKEWREVSESLKHHGRVPEYIKNQKNILID